MDAKVTVAQIGRYRIERLLGRGAMGVVYLASDPVIGRQIALKVLRLDLPGAEASAERLRTRFQSEARSAGILSHPNIVTVYDAIEQTEDGALCIAMEYVEGTNLSEILRRPEPLPNEFSLDVAAQIAEALDYAHGRGVIHRDVKPANAIVMADGRVKITDFGIAHLIDSALSDDLRFLGTPSYMAPERVEGREIDHRADLFSLGVVLYQLVTRHMPFKGSSVGDLTRSIARDEPIPPERFAPDMSPELRGILMRSLEKNPVRRYQHASAMASDLRAVLAMGAALRRTQPISVPGATTVTRLVETAAPRSRQARSLPKGVLLGAVAGLVLIGAGIAWWLSRGQARPVASAPTVTASAPHLPALTEGLLRFSGGDLASARDLLRTAEVLEPNSLRSRLWRQLAEDRLERDRAAVEMIDLMAAVEQGRAELARGRLRSAREALEEARAIDPDDAAVVDLASRLWLAQQPVQQESAPQPEPVRPPPPDVIAAQVVPIERAPLPDVATIQLDFFSQVSRGVLTVYNGQQQIYKEAFRFTERRRLLPAKAATGSLSATLEMPAGPLALRVYLSLPGRETQLEPVQAELERGGSYVLRLRVSSEGTLTSNLR
jgi:Protein kinase domain